MEMSVSRIHPGSTDTGLIVSERGSWKRLLYVHKQTLNSLDKELVGMRQCKTSWECDAFSCRGFTGGTNVTAACHSFNKNSHMCKYSKPCFESINWSWDVCRPWVSCWSPADSGVHCSYVAYVHSSPLLSRKCLDGCGLVTERTVWNIWKHWNQNALWISVPGQNVAQVKLFTTKFEICS